MFDLNPRFRNTQNHHSNYRHRFNELETMDEDSGVCSPPLWRNISPPDSPVRFPNSKSLSPASRAQAIARGQREMMEMVENMPETSYELSLKDIVEHRTEYTTTTTTPTDFSVDETQSMEEGEARLILRGGQESQNRRKNKKDSMRRQDSGNKTGRIIVKTGSMNHNKGLLINMFFPFSIGLNKKKKNNNSSIRTRAYHGSGVKSSPKRELLEKSGGGDGGGGDRRDWWKKFTDSGYCEGLGVTSTSSSGDSTGRSGSSGSSGSSNASSLRNNSDRRKNGCSYGCWSLFPFRKKKS